MVKVVYGTTQGTTSLKSGEFLISKQQHPDAFKQAGLSHDTKFDLKQALDLPWTDRYFKVPPGPNSEFGQTPKLGSLHASMMKAATAAYNATLK